MISREEAIKELGLKRTSAKSMLDSLPPKTREKSALNDEVEMLTMAIEFLSQPQRPKGRWIKRIRFSIADYTCSKCGCWTGDEHNYCPDCGAEMVRGEEE